VRKVLGSVALLSVMCLAGCADGNSAMKLKKTSTVYIPLAPASFESLDQALAEKGYGNVVAGDLKHKYLYGTAVFDGKTCTVILAYTEEQFIPSGTTYQPMSASQWLKVAVADESCEGIAFNPGREPPDSFSALKSDAAAALKTLPPQDPLPVKIMVKQ
jgi:hypothetical protein